MKILVTGSNGYLGQGIVKNILDKNVQVLAVDIKTEKIDKRAQIIKTDIFDLENPYEALNRPDVLLHLAWRDGFVHDSDVHIDDLPKHYHFIKKMISSGVDRVTIMGSMHEIGFYEGCVHENTPCNPMNLYGIAKVALKNAIEELAQKNNTNFQWLRGYYIVGNSKTGNSIFSKITQAESNNKKEFPFTMGQNQFDFLDYQSFCDRVAETVCQDEINGIIDICSGKPEKLADRVEKFIIDNHYHIKLKYGAYPDRLYDSKAIWGDNKKIIQILKNKGQNAVQDNEKK